MSGLEFDSVEQRDAHVEALRRERDALDARGRRDRVAAVDAELVRLGAGSVEERAATKQRRPRGGAAETRDSGGDG